MFFKNKSFNIKVVEDENAVVDSEPTDYNALIEKAVRGAVTVVAAYMGADTLRKIIVHTIATKIV
jgi:hypothetical protein